MAVGKAVQRENAVFIYDENGHATGAVSADRGVEDGHWDFNPSMVKIRRGDINYLYDECGRSIEE
jgi:hypothetical protein